MNKTTVTNLIQAIEEINKNLPKILEDSKTVKRSIEDLKRFERTNNIELNINFEGMLNRSELELYFHSEEYDNYDDIKEEFIRDTTNKDILNNDLIFQICQLEEGYLEESKDIKNTCKDIIKTLKDL
ncbi:MAG: hypothetical protein ACRDD7_08975 [Peptostreptococcaceae bacterium]